MVSITLQQKIRNKLFSDEYFIIKCPTANYEHKMSKRQYAHVHHYNNNNNNNNIICVAHAIWSLPDSHLLGILAHEIGHLISGGGERVADNIMLEKYEIKIQYASTDYGDSLQYLHAASAAKFLDLFGEKILC